MTKHLQGVRGIRHGKFGSFPAAREATCFFSLFMLAIWPRLEAAQRLFYLSRPLAVQVYPRHMDICETQKHDSRSERRGSICQARNVHGLRISLESPLYHEGRKGKGVLGTYRHYGIRTELISGINCHLVVMTKRLSSQTSVHAARYNRVIY